MKKENILGGRRFGRTIVLSALYQYEVSKVPLEKLVKLEWVDYDLTDDLKEFIIDLISGTINNIEKIDELIEKYSTNWSLNRISPVDKAILRFSIYSLLFRKDIPPSVAIDEAIEISKKYSTEKSYKFINGILDGIRKNEIKD